MSCKGQTHLHAEHGLAAQGGGCEPRHMPAQAGPLQHCLRGCGCGVVPSSCCCCRPDVQHCCIDRSDVPASMLHASRSQLRSQETLALHQTRRMPAGHLIDIRELGIDGRLEVRSHRGLWCTTRCPSEGSRVMRCCKTCINIDSSSAQYSLSQSPLRQNTRADGAEGLQ